VSAPGPPSSFLVADEGPVRWLTIHRPEARGALHLEGRNELVALLAAADNDEAVRCLVLTGTDPAFSAGVDLKERNPLTPQDRRFRVNPGKALRALRTPIICAVNGSCVTGGLEMALSCHFVIASTRATFADTHAKVGILPGWGLSALLPRAVGVRMARQLSITGARIDADAALRMGLVNEVVPHQALGERVREIASQVLACDDRAVRDLLQLYARGDGASLAEALALEEDALVNRVNTAASDRRDAVLPRSD
jgi:enoyl-CoA hydratase